jgi:hypothetical protein
MRLIKQALFAFSFLTLAFAADIPPGSTRLPLEEALLGSPNDASAIMRPLILNGLKEKFPETGEEAVRSSLKTAGKDTNFNLYYYSWRSELGNISKDVAVINGCGLLSTLSLRSNTTLLKSLVRTRAASNAVASEKTNTDLTDEEVATLKSKETVFSDKEKKLLRESDLYLTMCDIASGQIAIRIGTVSANIALLVLKAKDNILGLVDNNPFNVPLGVAVMGGVGDQLVQMGKRDKNNAKDIKARLEIMKALQDQKTTK